MARVGCSRHKQLSMSITGSRAIIQWARLSVRHGQSSAPNHRAKKIKVENYVKHNMNWSNARVTAMDRVFALPPGFALTISWPLVSKRASHSLVFSQNEEVKWHFCMPMGWCIHKEPCRDLTQHLLTPKSSCHPLCLLTDWQIGQI